MDEKQEAMINVGFRFDTEEMASILLNTTLTLRGLQGPRLGLTVRLNENPYIKLDFRSSNILMGRLSLSYMYKSNNYRLYRNGRGINNITFGQNRVELFFSPANPIVFNPKVGVSYEHFNYNSFLFASDDDRIAVKPEVRQLLPDGQPRNAERPLLSHAGRIGLRKSGSPYRQRLRLQQRNAVRIRIVQFPLGAVGHRPSDVHPLAVRAHAHRQRSGYSYYNYIGGEVAGRYMEQQIPFVGINHMETANRSVLTVNLEVRMRLFARHYISLKGAYGIQNENFFKMFTESRNLFGIGLKYAYNSPIGPISILFDVSNIDKSLGVYFSLGKTF